MSRRSWLGDLLGAPVGPDIEGSETLAASPITRWLDSAPAPLFSAYAIAAAFSTYFCMYAFRKPFSAASYDDVAMTVDLVGRSLDIKTVFVISQIVGYCASKYIGMKFCSEVARSKRFLFLIGAIVFAESALLLFAVLPVPLKIGAIFLNGLPLGVVWGLVVRYLEGRRTSEMLLAGLSCSYILASGEVKRFGQSLMLDYGVTEFWMPAATGACFFVPFVLAAFLLKQLPPPTEEDERLRTERHRMLSDDRWRFMKTFLPGMVMLSIAYFFLTAFRDYRDNYQADMFQEMNIDDPAVFSRTERPVAFAVMIVLAALTLVKSNRWGLVGAYVIMIAGLVSMGAGTAMFQSGAIDGEMWMILTGLGGYLAYVPYGSVLFDRTIAYSRFVGTAVFAIYLTDAIGYTGSVGLQLYKDLFSSTKSRLLFFQNFTYFMAGLGTVLMVMSLVYFLGKGAAGEEFDESKL